MSDPRPRARTIDPLPRTVLAWQRTLMSFAATALVITLGLVRSGLGIWSLAVLTLALVPIPAAVRRERYLLPESPAAVALWKPRLVTAVALLLAGGALALVLLG